MTTFNVLFSFFFLHNNGGGWFMFLFVFIGSGDVVHAFVGADGLAPEASPIPGPFLDESVGPKAKKAMSACFLSHRPPCTTP
mmetsp:Transcript_26517/g.67891  ORF Transcript_26517/g.67891 Transcript_26517/m.67891 type:complete len:82 (-) Transcript_26517:1044-1289(-)